MASWIIVVDDDVTNLKMAGQILSKNNMRVTALKSGRALLDYVRSNSAPDLILLDIMMPDMDGFETYESFRKLEAELSLSTTPIVFLTADEDKSSESKGFEMGVSDFIRKPFDPDVLVRRVNNIVSTHGQMLKFEKEATVDKLTGFYNKYNANEQIEKLCAVKEGALIIADLDSFKLVNDIFGHDMGDKILSSFSGILKNRMTFDAVFGRIGGDEFLLFADGMTNVDDIAEFSKNVNADLVSVAKSLMGEDMRISLGTSLGVVFVPEFGTDFNKLFNFADRALYKVKNDGKHGFAVYSENVAETDFPDDISLDKLTSILEERNIPQNAIWMGKDAFGNVYRYMIRYMDRYRGTAYKMLFTAHFVPKDLSESEKEKIMVSLRELLQESLRNSDILMQIGDCHFFLMLPEISDYNADRVTDRVMHAWENNQYSSLVKLKVETQSTTPEAHEGVTYRNNDENVIYVASDDPEELGMISGVLMNKGYSVNAFSNGDELLSYMSENIPDLIIIKGHMSGLSGFDTIVEIKKKGGAMRHIPIVLISGDNDDDEKRGLELDVEDFIRMPISSEKLYLRIKNLIKFNYLKDHMNREVEKKSEENEQLSMHIIKALAFAIDAKDRYTNGHSSRVAEYSREIASRYGYSEKDQNDIYIIGLLHDVGKIGIPDAIINKNSKLDDEEYAIIKRHPVIGTQILETITEMPNLSNGARWHHERYDGNGYPDGLSGEDIPEVARIIAVADAYDAMTSRRSYRDTLPQNVVREEFVKCSGKQFDPKFAQIMLQIIDEDKDYQLREQ